MYHLSSIIHHLHLSSIHILYVHPSSILVGTCIKAARLCVVVVFVVVEERATP
jgi:hypothetical protein